MGIAPIPVCRAIGYLLSLFDGTRTHDRIITRLQEVGRRRVAGVVHRKNHRRPG
jgi:hypothetical protein